MYFRIYVKKDFVGALSERPSMSIRCFNAGGGTPSPTWAKG